MESGLLVDVKAIDRLKKHVSMQFFYWLNINRDQIFIQ